MIDVVSVVDSVLLLAFMLKDVAKPQWTQMIVISFNFLFFKQCEEIIDRIFPGYSIFFYLIMKIKGNSLKGWKSSACQQDLLYQTLPKHDVTNSYNHVKTNNSHYWYKRIYKYFLYSLECKN